MFRRFRHRRKFIFLLVMLGIILLILLQWFQSGYHDSADNSVDTPERISLDPTLTIILQDFDPFHNNIYKTSKHIASNFPSVMVLIVARNHPYPPVVVPKLPNVKFIALKNDVKNSLNGSRPEYHIQSNFVLFIPDGCGIDTYFMKAFKSFVLDFDEKRNEGYAIPVQQNRLTCHGIKFSVKSWTLEIGGTLQTNGKCGFVTGDHGILLLTKHLYSLSDPFLSPTFMSLYIQFSLVYLKTVIYERIQLINLNQEKLDSQTVWQKKQSHAQNLRHLFSELGIKLVLRGENRQEEWYGCSKESARCFDTVYHDMPEFLYRGRWTPPCCLKNLRVTGHHVFSILDGCKVRYWLEGGSLLGAVRSGDIIPWDYDIDIGIYQEDLIKCPQLVKVTQEAFVDEDGFLWEKAIEGEFYRVQFSETNHLHVDIFPFFSRNGVMTKNTWFKTHRQDTEFPEHFLKPLTRIQFAGLSVSAPNHVRDFLEYKFGKGVIESPKYPNAEIVV